MVDGWLVHAMSAYNADSLANKDGYRGLVMMSGETLEQLLHWTLESLPDEILIGLDADNNRPHRQEVEELFEGVEHDNELFAGQGYILKEPTIVNRGDSYSVHHVPEEWTDGIFSESRGPRGGRFVHWLHTHPNAVAIPSQQDAEAAQYTLGVDMILGIEFSPSGPFGWYEDAEGVRRKLQPDYQNDAAEKSAPDTSKRGWGRWRSAPEKPVLGIAPTGHKIHGLELISFHRSGNGINVIFVDDDGFPYGWPDF
ncbi:MAG: hypothetical protein HOE69_05180 [Euryarchaeota archaeon]|jgi:proteasome lid subunit RPN8/RPN11|nr:hypothetical protein [Euryarchaeota archaeon]